MSDATAPEPPYDALAHIRTDGVRFLDILVDHDLSTPVRSTPDWTLGDLGWHLGTVWEFWGTIVSERIVDFDPSTYTEPTRPSDGELIDWITAAHTALYSALVDSRTGRQVWTWAGEHDAAWVRRRMTIETAIHRWDAAETVGRPYAIPTAVAADGIDEFLMWFVRPAADATPVGGSIHIHCTDTNEDIAEGTDDRSKVDGEWMISSVGEGGATFERTHAKGDVAIRGRAADILLWLWRRDAGPVEFLGDAGVAERFRAFTDLS